MSCTNASKIVCANVAAETTFVTIDNDLLVTGHVNIVSGNLLVNNIKVIGDQKLDIPNLIDTILTGSLPGTIVPIVGTGEDANLNANFANVVITLNMVMDVIRAHGLMG